MRRDLGSLITLSVAALSLTACARGADRAQVSRSGAYSVRAEVAGDDAGVTRRGCLRLHVVERGSGSERTVQTGAAAAQKWALAWAPGDALVLQSADVGTVVFEVAVDAIKERAPAPGEIGLGRAAYAEKYGKPAPK